MLLYSYKLAGEYKGAVQSGTVLSQPAGSLMIELAGALDTFLGAERSMLYRPGSRTLSILYQDVLLRCEDLMEYGGLLAGVNKKWKREREHALQRNRRNGIFSGRQLDSHEKILRIRKRLSPVGQSVPAARDGRRPDG